MFLFVFVNNVYSQTTTFPAQLNAQGTPINLGNSSDNQAINIATGGGQKTLTLGSSNTTSATTIQSGTGNILMNPFANFVGINTTSPTQPLTVGGNIFMNLDNTGFGIGAGTTSSLGFIKKTGSQGVIVANATNPIIFGNTDQTNVLTNITGAVITERMRLTATGSLGIGTATPNATLDVVGSLATSNTVTNAASYTLNATDHTVILNLAGAQTVNYPTASTVTRREYLIVNPTTTAKTFAAVVTGINNATTTVIPANSSTRIKSDGSIWRVVEQTIQSTTPAIPTIVSFTANGTYTPSAGLKYAVVEMCGGGGGGAGSVAGSGTNASIGGSGSGGGYIKFMLTPAQIGASQTITIGTAGTQGIGGTAGGNGGNTTFGTLATANGGTGGIAGAASAATIIRAGRSGGTTTLTTGTLITQVQGGKSQEGTGFVTGGSFFVVAGSGGDCSNFGTGGLSSIGNLPTGTANTSSTSNGTGFGAGGNGSFSVGTGTGAVNGSFGAAGKVIITEYF